MDLQSIRLPSLEQSEQSEQVRIFLLCSILCYFYAFPHVHCLSSGCKEYFWNDIKSVNSTSANVSWVVKFRIQGRPPPPPAPHLFLDQTEGPRAENKNFWRPVPYLMSGLPPSPSPPLIWRSGSATERPKWARKKNLLHKRKNKQDTRDT